MPDEDKADPVFDAMTSRLLPENRGYLNRIVLRRFHLAGRPDHNGWRFVVQQHKKYTEGILTRSAENHFKL